MAEKLTLKPLQIVRGGGHQPGRCLHQGPHRRRQLGGTGVLCFQAVASLVVFHLRHDGARIMVAGRQAL